MAEKEEDSLDLAFDPKAPSIDIRLNQYVFVSVWTDPCWQTHVCTMHEENTNTIITYKMFMLSEL